MDITIVALLTPAAHNPRIAFATPWGEGHGMWIGAAPCIGQRYGVELDIAETSVWGETIVRTDGGVCGVARRDDVVVIDGFLEQVEPTDAETLCIVRLDTSLVMIQTIGTLPLPGVWVRLWTPNLRLCDTNL